MTDSEIDSLIFWMLDRYDRHFYRRGDGIPLIVRVASIYQRQTTIGGKGKLLFRRYRQGIYCPVCWDERKDWSEKARRQTRVLNMYRKHLVDGQGEPVGIVHISQCMDCLSVAWAPVGVLNYDLATLKISRAKKVSPRPLRDLLKGLDD